MASAHVIVDHTENLEKTTVEEAYEKIVAWLVRSGGKIDEKKTVKPSFIEAKHGSYTTVSGWAKNAKKIMKFYLTSTETGTRLRLTIEPTLVNVQDVVSWRSEVERNWTELADELWLEFGIYGKSILEEKSWGKAPQIRVLEDEKRSAVNQLKLGTFFFIILCFGFILILQGTPELTKVSEIWTATIVVFSLLFAPTILLMLYGTLKFVQLRSKIRKLKGSASIY